MKQKCQGKTKNVRLIVFTALGWILCILFYTSFLWKKKTLVIAFVIAVILGLACKKLPYIFTRTAARLGAPGWLRQQLSRFW